MWWGYYLILTIVLLVIGFVVYVFRKGYNKVKPAPLKGFVSFSDIHFTAPVDWLLHDKHRRLPQIALNAIFNFNLYYDHDIIYHQPT